MSKDTLSFLQANALVRQAESPHEKSPVESDMRITVRARSVTFFNYGTDVVYINDVPLSPNGGSRVASASWNGILWQDYTIRFTGVGTQLLYITEMTDVGQTTNF